MVIIRLFFLIICLTSVLNAVEFTPLIHDTTYEFTIHLTNDQLREVILLSVFIGTFVSLFIYNIFLYFSTKQKDYLLYVLSILFLSIWLFLSHGYIHYADITYLLKSFLMVGTILFFTLFSCKFFNLNTIFNPIALFLFMVLSLLIFFLMLSNPILGEYFSEIVLVTLSFMGLYFSLLSYKKNYLPSKYYILALLGYIIGSIVSFLMHLKMISPNFYIFHSQLMGSMWTMIFLSLALGYKISRLHLQHNETLFKAQVQEKMLFLQSRQAIIGELIGNIAHQWKEPLAEVGAIQTNLQANIVIKGSISKEKVLDSAEKSSSIIRHLADTIDVFYRFFSHQKSKKGEFNIIKEILNIQKMVYYSLKIENITLELVYSEDILAFGDNNEFANALLNIILNAKDILVERKIENPTIVINVSQNDNAIIITIEDNAGGVTQKPINKIFESCISSKDNNIGIGLYLTKTIIEKRLRGKITVENSSNGALFTIILPLVWEMVEIEYPSNNSLNIEKSTLERLCTLERKVEKQEETQKALRQWEDIFNQTHWAVTLHEGVSNSFKMVNPAFYTMYNYRMETIKSMSLVELFAPESLEIFAQKQKEAFEKCFATFEAIHIRNDGSKFPVSIDLTVIKNEHDDILYYITNIRDISEQKNAHKSLLLKKFALNHVHEAVYLMDERGYFKYINKAACLALGYSESELLQLNIGDVDADWPIERWPEHWEEIKKTKTMTMELRHKRKDGTIFPVEVLANYFEYEGVGYNMGLARDISERKTAEENLLLKEFALNKISEAVFLIDENAQFHYINEATCKSLGYTHEEILQMSVPDIDSYVSIDWWKEHWHDIATLNNTLTLTKHKRKDGTTFPIEISSNYFEYNGRGYSLAVSRDITERLIIQKRKDEEKMRLFFDHQLVGMAITSPTKGWLHVNNKLSEMIGYSFDELKNMTWAEVTHPDDLALDVDGFNRMLSGEIDSYTVEKRYICKDKSIVFAYLSIGCVRKEDGSVDFVLALIDDITERKKAEEEIKTLNATLEEKVLERTSELAKKEREFRTLAENMPNFLSRYDKKGSRIYVNPVLCNYFGVSSDELLGTTPYKNPLIEPLELQEKIDYVLQTGHKTHMEIAHEKEGNKRYWTLVFAPEFDEKGNVDGVISIGHDITYIKQAEEQLQLLKTAINNASDALYIVDDERNICYVSEASCRMLGYSYEEFLTMKVEDIDPNMPINEIDKVREKVNEFTTTTFQTNHRTKNGKILDVEITVTKFLFNDTDLRLSIVKDITQQIRYEEEINELNRNLEQKVIERTKELEKALEFNKSIIQAIPDMLFEVSKEGIYLNIWARDEKLLAAQKELLLGKNFKDMLPPDAVEVSIKTMKEVDIYGSSLGNTYKLELHDGEHWFELHTIKKEPDGNYLALVRDVTDRKQAQNELLNLNTTLEEKVKDRTYALQKALEWSEEIINTLPDILFEMDIKGNYLGVWTQNKELLAQQKEILLGNNIYNVLSKEAANTIIEALEEANNNHFSSGKKISIHLPLGTKEFELSISKKTDGNFLLLSRDIDLRKK